MLIEHWSDLEVLYREEVQRKDGVAPKLYALMRELTNSVRAKDGTA